MVDRESGDEEAASRTSNEEEPCSDVTVRVLAPEETPDFCELDTEARDAVSAEERALLSDRDFWDREARETSDLPETEEKADCETPLLPPERREEKEELVAEHTVSHAGTVGKDVSQVLIVHWPASQQIPGSSDTEEAADSVDWPDERDSPVEADKSLLAEEEPPEEGAEVLPEEPLVMQYIWHSRSPTSPPSTSGGRQPVGGASLHWPFAGSQQKRTMLETELFFDPEETDIL